MTERRVLVRPLAADDIVEVAQTIATDDAAAAERSLAAVRRECEILRAFPRLGRARAFRAPHLAGFRSRPVSGFRSWLLFYRVRPDAIDVVRVLHGARDLPTVLGDDWPERRVRRPGAGASRAPRAGLASPQGWEQGTHDPADRTPRPS